MADYDTEQYSADIGVVSKQSAVSRVGLICPLYYTFVLPSPVPPPAPVVPTGPWEITQITDHEDRAIATLLSQFGSSNV